MRAYLRADPAVGASTAALGAWLRLYSYGAELEAGGLIPGAAGHDDRRWLSLAMVTRAEVEDAVAAGLCEWRGDDLAIGGYDVDGEAKVHACRLNGKSGGRPPKTKAEPGGKPSGKPNGNHAVSPGLTQEKPLSSPFLSPPLLSSPSPTSPRTGTGAEPSLVSRDNSEPAPDQAQPARGSVWSPSEWQRRYGISWSRKYGRISYGMSGDPKACSNLADLLERMPEAEVLAAQESADEMIGSFLASEAPGVVKARHPFAFFVTEFGGLRVPQAAPASRSPYGRLA
jgi:hypothetical protein